LNWSEINRRELLTKALAGLAGGIAAWIPLEIWFNLYPEADKAATLPSDRLGLYSFYIVMMLLPAFVGMLIVATDLQPFALTPKNRRLLLIAFLICFALGLPAEYWSNLIFNKLLPVDRSSTVLSQWIFARSIAWTELGLLVGLGIGVSTFSVPNIAKGAVGGLLGGFIGGLLFDPINTAFSPGVSRAFSLGETGLMIGLFIGLVQNLTKNAWLKVETGRLRNREFRLDKALTTLGRAEECDVGLFGDSAIEPRHARIEHRGNDFFLDSLGHQLRVNSRPVSNAQLRSGDSIEIGSYSLRFNLRNAPANVAAAVSPAPAPYASSTPAPRSVSAAAPRLIDSSGKQFDLHPASSTSLGRAQENDVVLADKSISRRHATITPADGGFYLRDLQSQNGTYVESERVNEYLLRDGDQIRLGDLQFVFRA
jgi:pSer/pThr/pTyr-binding forkhead associated (FHA) protein